MSRSVMVAWIEYGMSEQKTSPAAVNPEVRAYRNNLGKFDTFHSPQ
jgi:hypothetical protein